MKGKCLLLGMLVLGACALEAKVNPPEALLPIPDQNQMRWQEREQYMFFHFGVNTFSNREWGDGKEDPKSFNPTELNAEQWVKAAKDGGFKMIILTAKHHDGFCLWPSAYTEHSVKNSPWKDGKGDVVREVCDACKKYGLDFGVYLSPWDRNSKYYGDSPKYNEYYKSQLRELLTNYAPISMVWLDGACGEGPNGKKQNYDWEGYYEIVKELAPDAVIFGGNIRWIGNEDGLAQETCWSPNPAPGVNEEANTNSRWNPAECDVSIRPGWFYHETENDKVKSLDHLLDIYHRSVGHNCCLHLNVPPSPKGLLHENDVARLKEFKEAIDKGYQTNLALNKKAKADSYRGKSKEFAPKNLLDADRTTYWALDDSQTTGSVEINLGKKPVTFNRILLQEYVELGQRVSAYHVDAWDAEANEWKQIAKGTTIGYKWLLRVPDTTTTKVRLVIDESRACPTISSFELYQF